MSQNLVPDNIVSGQGNGGIPTSVRFHICGLMHTLLDYAVSRVYSMKAHTKSSGPVTNEDIRRGLIYEIISPGGIGKQLHEIFDSVMMSASENINPQMGIYEHLVQVGKISLDVATTMKKAVAYAQFMLEMNLLNEYKQSLSTVVINRIPIEDLICEINEELLTRQRQNENMDEGDDEEYDEDDEEYDEDEEEYDANEEEYDYSEHNKETCHNGCDMHEAYKNWENLESLFSTWKPDGLVGELCMQAINSIPS